MNSFDPSILQWGDMMLYFTEGSLNPAEDIVDFGIAVKTGMRVAHVEGYYGNNQSVASRNGVGVNVYPMRLDGLVCVRRAKNPIYNLAGETYFNSVKGQGYDFKGLLTFTSLDKTGSPNDQFCSEFYDNWIRSCGIDAFNPHQPAVCTSPRDLWISPAFNTIWKVSNEY